MMNDLYEESYFLKRLNSRNIDAYTNDLNFVNQCMPIKSNVLDYGCGEMVYTDLLSEKHRISVFDISEEVTKTKRYNSYDVYSTSSRYDCIVLRGVLQHHPSPFELISKLCSQINKSGSIIFLATPNTNSLYYHLNHELPALDRKNNFWVPSNIELVKYMNKIGWAKYNEQYPYLKSGYAKPFADHASFLLNVLGIKRRKYPFWGSMMNIAFNRG